MTLTHNGTVSTAHGGFAVGQTVGAIYLGDIGRRNSLGGGASIYGLGQDQYLHAGTPITVVATSDVLLSQASGLLAMFVTMGVITIS